MLKLNIKILLYIYLCSFLFGNSSQNIGLITKSIGNVKYKAQHECLKLMCETNKPVYLHFEHAFEFAQKNA